MLALFHLIILPHIRINLKKENLEIMNQYRDLLNNKYNSFIFSKHFIIIIGVVKAIIILRLVCNLKRKGLYKILNQAK